MDSRDLHADPERQYLTKELATKAFDALSPELRNTFILQKGGRLDEPGSGGGPGHYGRNREIQDLSGAR